MESVLSPLASNSAKLSSMIRKSRSSHFPSRTNTALVKSISVTYPLSPPALARTSGVILAAANAFAAVASDVATTATSTSVVPAHANVATAHVTNNRTKSRPPSVSGVISPYPTVVTVVTAQ